MKKAGANILEERRRALVRWVGDLERVGETAMVHTMHEALVGEGKVFPTDGVMMAIVADLDDERGSTHLRRMSATATGGTYAVALTERGRAWYDAMRSGRIHRALSWVGGESLTIVIAAVTAVVTTIAARLAERWLFP